MVVTKHVHGAWVEDEVFPSIRRQTEPAHSEHTEHMPVGERVARYRARLGDHAIHPRTYLRRLLHPNNHSSRSANPVHPG